MHQFIYALKLCDSCIIFQCILGDRYGFRPIPVEMNSEEFDMLYHHGELCSLPDLHLLKEWYSKDDNAVPPVYVLQVAIPY